MRAVGFLDFASYTALMDVPGDDAAANVVERFCAVVGQALDEQDVLVKSIGDAVLVHSSDADALASSPPGSAAASTPSRRSPCGRVGVHVGPVVLRPKTCSAEPSS